MPPITPTRIAAAVIRAASAAGGDRRAGGAAAEREPGRRAAAGRRRSPGRRRCGPESSSTRITEPAITPGRVPSRSGEVSGARSDAAAAVAQQGAGGRDHVVEQVGRRDRRARRVQDADLDRTQEDRARDADRRRHGTRRLMKADGGPDHRPRAVLTRRRQGRRFSNDRSAPTIFDPWGGGRPRRSAA